MNNFIKDKEYYSDFRRKIKSISDRILLLDVYYYPISNFTQCKILGSTDKEYCINIKINQNNEKTENDQAITEDKLNISCSCMDYQMRKQTCKHIYWFCRYSLKEKNMDPKCCKTSQLYEFLYNYLNINKSIKGRNENCPICLEKIDYNNENFICCVDSCGNAVHNICWSRYKYISDTNKCVFCRHPYD